MWFCSASDRPASRSPASLVSPYPAFGTNSPRTAMSQYRWIPFDVAALRRSTPARTWRELRHRPDPCIYIRVVCKYKYLKIVEKGTLEG